jgi:hypothetical protein
MPATGISESNGATGPITVRRASPCRERRAIIVPGQDAFQARSHLQANARHSIGKLIEDAMAAIEVASGATRKNFARYEFFSV